MHVYIQALMFQGQSNGAAARAKVYHVGCERQQRQSPVHQGFGISARTQYTRIDLQLQAVKRGPASDVGHGLTRTATRKCVLPTLLRGYGKCLVVVRQKPSAFL